MPHPNSMCAALRNFRSTLNMSTLSKSTIMKAGCLALDGRPCPRQVLLAGPRGRAGREGPGPRSSPLHHWKHPSRPVRTGLTTDLKISETQATGEALPRTLHTTAETRKLVGRLADRDAHVVRPARLRGDQGRRQVALLCVKRDNERWGGGAVQCRVVQGPCRAWDCTRASERVGCCTRGLYTRSKAGRVLHKRIAHTF